MSRENPTGDARVIYAYTRTDAIRDGVLIDVTDTAREAGFGIPVALTVAAWADCVAWSEDDNARKGTIQDEAGRLWDVVWMAARRAPRQPQPRTLFELLRVPREGRRVRPQLVRLVLHIGPGDGGEPVITIMLPGED